MHGLVDSASCSPVSSSCVMAGELKMLCAPSWPVLRSDSTRRTQGWTRPPVLLCLVSFCAQRRCSLSLSVSSPSTYRDGSPCTGVTPTVEINPPRLWTVVMKTHRHESFILVNKCARPPKASVSSHYSSSS